MDRAAAPDQDRGSGLPRTASLVLPPPATTLTWLAAPLVVFALGNLVMAALIGQFGQGWLIAKLSLDGESTVPAYYNTLLLVLAAVLFGLQAAVSRRRSDPMAWRWAVLAAAAAAMSVDEASGLHEIVGERFGQLLPDEGLPYNSWVFLGAAFAAVVGLTVLPLLRRLPDRTRTGLLLAAALFLSGAIGMELAAEPAALASQWTGSWYLVLMTVEEVLEMSAVLLVIATMLRHLSAEGGLRVVVAQGPRETSPTLRSLGRPVDTAARARTRS